MGKTQQAGNLAEQRALDYLIEQRLQLVERNFRCQQGEIDLIMRDKQTLVFVEVRFRGYEHYGGSLSSVTPTKQRRLIQAAKFFLFTHEDFNKSPCRFDVIGISARQFEWIQHAFDVPLWNTFL